MKIEYDREVDAVYIQILNEPIKESEEVAHDVIVDFTADNRVAGIEVLNASKRIEIMESLRNLLQLEDRKSFIASS